ncbi:MAG: NAD(P)-dependent oxidoreductase [Rhodobacteraceae bacterium]|nr:NAD(P)-dependent oxidoreductase [Paracoccaceae bacterium]
MLGKGGLPGTAIGLGLMGRAMVSRLLDLGYPLTILGNRDRSGLDEALGRGAKEAGTAKELAASTDIVMLCMGTSAHVEARAYGPDGFIEGAKPDQIVIDFGTSLPASTRKIGAALAANSAIYMDAPLGRTPSHAYDGKLNIMAAGSDAAYQRVHPVLTDLGENVFHLGALGAGHTIKLINNFYGMTTAAAMSEAFAMADAAGVERQKLYSVMAAGPLRSGMMDFIRNYAVDGQMDLAFSIANAAKDVGYYREMASALGAQSRMSTGTHATLTEARDNGAAEKMVPELLDYLSQHLKD